MNHYTCSNGHAFEAEACPRFCPTDGCASRIITQSGACASHATLEPRLTETADPRLVASTPRSLITPGLWIVTGLVAILILSGGIIFAATQVRKMEASRADWARQRIDYEQRIAELSKATMETKRLSNWQSQLQETSGSQAEERQRLQAWQDRLDATNRLQVAAQQELKNWGEKLASAQARFNDQRSHLDRDQESLDAQQRQLDDQKAALRKEKDQMISNTTTSTQAPAASKPRLPIVGSWQTHVNPYTGTRSLIFVGSNRSGHAIVDVTVMAINDLTGESDTWSSSIMSVGDTVTVGLREHWFWQPGERLVISAPGYDSAVWICQR